MDDHRNGALKVSWRCTLSVANTNQANNLLAPPEENGNFRSSQKISQNVLGILDKKAPSNEIQHSIRIQLPVRDPLLKKYYRPKRFGRQ